MKDMFGNEVTVDEARRLLVVVRGASSGNPPPPLKLCSKNRRIRLGYSDG